MTNIEQKALELVNEVRAEYGYTTPITYDWFNDDSYEHIAFLSAIEQHERFRQEVSDAVEKLINSVGHDGIALGRVTHYLADFILPKPVDPLVEVAEELRETYCATGADWAKATRAALAKRGLEIREKE